MPTQPKLTLVQSKAATAEPRIRQAFERARADIQQVSQKRLVPIRIDVSDLVSAALGVVPRVLPFRERARALPEFDVRCFDLLETHALALLQAHTRYRVTSAAKDEVPELARRARALRATLLSDIRSLQQRKLVPRDALKRISHSTGHKSTATDLTVLAHILRRDWANLAGRTGAQAAELDEAEALALQLMQALGGRPTLSRAVREAAHVRAQAYALLLETYSEVQRALSFLRWRERDAEKFAPSLFRGFVGRPRKAKVKRPRRRSVRTPSR